MGPSYKRLRARQISVLMRVRLPPQGPTLNTIIWAFSSIRRAPALHAGGSRGRTDKVHHFFWARRSTGGRNAGSVQIRVRFPACPPKILPVKHRQRCARLVSERCGAHIPRLAPLLLWQQRLDSGHLVDFTHQRQSYM